MSLSIAAANYLNWTPRSAATSAPASPQPDPSASDSPSASQSQPALTTTDIVPLSTSGLPQIQMPSDMLAAIQSGSWRREADPARTAAQNASPAYAVVKDADTGAILGGVWPGAATVSKLNIPVDDRLTGNSDWGQVTQYLAQDISQFTGKNVTVQYYQPGDPDAPTFGSVMG